MLSLEVFLPHLGHSAFAFTPGGLPRPLLLLLLPPPPLLLPPPAAFAMRRSNALVFGFALVGGLCFRCDDGSDLDAASTVALAIFAASSEGSAPLVRGICCATVVGAVLPLMISAAQPLSPLAKPTLITTIYIILVD